jgi:hypothetical protein
LSGFRGLVIEELSVFSEGRFFGVRFGLLGFLKELKEFDFVGEIGFLEGSLERVVKIMTKMAFLGERLADVLGSKIESLGVDES